MNTDLMFSSKSNNWQTPKPLFDYWNNIYHFDLDAAASKENTLCEKYYNEEMDALKQEWHKDAKTAFCNPPYSRIGAKFVQKGYEESLKGCIVVFLIAARPDTKIWANYVSRASEIIFVIGRIKFINSGNSELTPAPFPSAFVIFNSQTQQQKIYWKKF